MVGREIGRIDRSTVGKTRTEFDPVQLHHFFLYLVPYFVYILKSETDNSFYVGHTSNLNKRLFEHNSGKSLSTRRKRPWKLIYREEFLTRSEAILREKHFKSIQGRLELKAKGIL